MSYAANYLSLVEDSRGRVPKDESLEDHRKHCRAKKGNCPFEKELDDSDGDISLAVIPTSPDEVKAFHMDDAEYDFSSDIYTRLPNGLYRKNGETRPHKGSLPVGRWFGTHRTGTHEIQGMIKVGEPIDLWDPKNDKYRKDAQIEGTSFDKRNRWYFPIVDRVSFMDSPSKATSSHGQAYSGMSRKESVHRIKSYPDLCRQTDPHFSLGAPYWGSKGLVAERIVGKLPKGKRFVDLFAGGGAMTHAAMLSGKYDSYRMNDIDGRGLDLFVKAINGEYEGYDKNYEASDWEKIRETPDAHLWSRMGDGRSFNKDASERARMLRRVQRIGRQVGDRKELVDASKSDYRDVEIKPGDVVYADIPYADTDRRSYSRAGSFDYDAFDKWAAGTDSPVYVSSYRMGDGWTEIGSFKTRGITGGKTERLFVQSRFANNKQG